MEEKKDINEMNERELLAELLRQQSKSSKNSRLLVIIMAIITAVFVIVAVMIVPQALKIVNEANATLESGQTVLANADDMITGIIKVTDNLDSLVVENTETITESMAKIKNIDFDSLNKSIKALSDVLEPLANFFNIF